MKPSSESDSTPPEILVLPGTDWDLVMTRDASAIACGDEPPVLLQNMN